MCFFSLSQKCLVNNCSDKRVARTSRTSYFFANPMEGWGFHRLTPAVRA